MKKLLFIVFIIFSISSMIAQSNPDGEFWVTGRVEIKNSMTGEFEKAAALKTKKYNNSQETAMTTYKVMDGPDQGKYERIQGYKTLDWFNSNMMSGTGYKYWQNNVSQYVQNYEGRKIWIRIENLSLNWGPEVKPKKHIHRQIRIIKPGRLGDFWRFSNRITEVYKKHNHTGVRAVFKITSGDNENMMVIVNAFDDFKDQGKFPNTEKSLMQLYNEMYNESWDKDLEIYNDAIEMWGRQKERLSLVPELSTEL